MKTWEKEKEFRRAFPTSTRKKCKISAPLLESCVQTFCSSCYESSTRRPGVTECSVKVFMNWGLYCTSNLAALWTEGLLVCLEP